MAKKNKTNKSVKKRISATGSGKLKHAVTGGEGPPLLLLGG